MNLKNKFLTILFVFILLFTNVVFAEENNAVASSEIIEEQNFVNLKIKKEMKDSISLVYGKENSDIIYKKVLAHIENAKKQRSESLTKQDISRTSDWYKNEIEK